MSVTLEQRSRGRVPSATTAAASGSSRDPSTWAPNEHINRALVDPVHPLALPAAARVRHRRHLDGGGAGASSCTSSACSRSPAATTATSRTAATGSAASRSSCSRSSARPRRRRARCGGPRTTARTTSTPTPSETSTRRSAASGGATSVGSSATSTTRPTATRSRTSRKYPELVWLDKHDWVAPWSARRRVLPHRRLERAGHRLLRCRRWCCGTRRSCVNSLAHVFGRRVYETDRHEPEHRRSSR